MHQEKTRCIERKSGGKKKTVPGPQPKERVISKGGKLTTLSREEVPEQAINHGPRDHHGKGNQDDLGNGFWSWGGIEKKGKSPTRTRKIKP